MNYIDINQACIEGLMIKSEQVAAFANHRLTMDLRKKEQEHVKTCSICNPTLLAEQWFGKPVRIVTEAHYVGKNRT